jgi:VWFA-related protein
VKLGSGNSSRNSILFALLAIVAINPSSSPAQPSAVPDANARAPVVKGGVDEVLLDIVVQDKKGKPITDLKPGDVTVIDNGVKQKITSFRLVHGAEAITQTGATTKLDPLRQIRLVTLAFEAISEADQRKMARTAALDLINGDQGTNVFYSVVMLNTRLLVLQPFTNDKDALAGAIERATTGLAMGKLISESDAIKDELRRTLGPQAGQDTNLIAAAGEAAGQTSANGPPFDPTKAVLTRVLLDMLRMDAAVAGRNARMSITALAALVQGQQAMPGRKSVLYFATGMYVPSELDTMFRNLMGMANRANVTFYAVDTRGVMTASQNTFAASQLNAAARASAITVNRTSGAVTREEVMSSDDALGSARYNVQIPLRDLAESTGGFLIGDSNDLRGPLRHVNEEISSYYEVTFNPGIQHYDGAFRKLAVDAGRKGLVIHARNGYFALPPEAHASGLQAFEMPLLEAISSGKTSRDVAFRAGVVMLQSKDEGSDVSVLVEVQLAGLQPKTDQSRKSLSVHCSIVVLLKTSSGEVVQKLSRDRSFIVTADQLKMGNFVDKLTARISPGKYSYTPNAQGLDPADAFQFQGGSITPTLNASVQRSKDAALRLFFTVYQDSSIPAKPTVVIEFLRTGKSLTKAPMPLPPADAQGKIPYVMTIPAATIPPGAYELLATARQGDTAAESRIVVNIEAPKL